MKFIKTQEFPPKSYEFFLVRVSSNYTNSTTKTNYTTKN